VYDKTVRRRRAVLGLLVACSLILLTAYFGESAGGGLHSVQRGFLEVLSPVQEGASRALKPARDLFGWVGDTFHAKGEVKDLKKERDLYRAEAIRYRQAETDNIELNRLLNLHRTQQLAQQGPVSARVIARNPTVWYSKIGIDRGSSHGVALYQPVVAAGGLIGLVSAVTSHSAQVTLISDHSSGVAAKIAETDVPGILQPGTPGNPGDLLLQYIPRVSGAKVPVVGQRIVSSGISSSTGNTSRFPVGIPIGKVTEVDPNELDSSHQVHVRAFADLQNLQFVEVLTKPQVGQGQ
jgi:rod shape-determining protein MreC